MLSTKSFIGLASAVTGLALPVIAYVGGRVYLADVASYGGPMNYGAIFMAYRALQISVFVGGCLASGGLVFSIMSLRVPPTKTADRRVGLKSAGCLD
jgi:hypothetical protein